MVPLPITPTRLLCESAPEGIVVISSFAPCGKKSWLIRNGAFEV
jgi:hypothetical protein